MIEAKGGDSSESRYVERLLRVKAQRYEQGRSRKAKCGNGKQLPLV